MLGVAQGRADGDVGGLGHGVILERAPGFEVSGRWAVQPTCRAYRVVSATGRDCSRSWSLRMRRRHVTRSLRRTPASCG
ncbi:hypothetical protein XCR_3671 [Xanthomonas campestris pv. raphani 756C]|nr:hypothetical protein XCR_3671 [Xanthomonas campestris pv. raphani 756C]